MNHQESGRARVLDELAEHDHSHFGWFIGPDSNRAELREAPEQR